MGFKFKPVDRRIKSDEFIPAPAPMWLTLNAKDCKLGKPDDPFNCAFARSAGRIMPDIVQTQILDTVAYFEFRGRGGRKGRVMYYTVPDATREQIRANDHGTLRGSPGQYLFLAVSSSDILPTRREREKKRNEKRNRPTTDAGRRVEFVTTGARATKDNGRHLVPRGQRSKAVA